MRPVFLFVTMIQLVLLMTVSRALLPADISRFVQAGAPAPVHSPTTEMPGRCLQPNEYLVCDEILHFWLQGGGAQIYGLPIGNATSRGTEQADGSWQGTVQWFAHACIEHQPGRQPAVQLCAAGSEPAVQPLQRLERQEQENNHHRSSAMQPTSPAMPAPTDTPGTSPPPDQSEPPVPPVESQPSAEAGPPSTMLPLPTDTPIPPPVFLFSPTPEPSVVVPPAAPAAATTEAGGPQSERDVSVPALSAPDGSGAPFSRFSPICAMQDCSGGDDDGDDGARQEHQQAAPGTSPRQPAARPAPRDPPKEPADPPKMP